MTRDPQVRALQRADVQRLRKSLTLFHTWRSVVLLVQNDSSAGNVTLLSRDQVAFMHTHLRETAEYVKIVDVLKFVLIDGPVQPNVILRQSHAKQIYKVLPGPSIHPSIFFFHHPSIHPANDEIIIGNQGVSRRRD